MSNTLGLVMTGGGARGAYQAGVLKRIGELKRAKTRGNPFPIIGGTSAGAINGAALAAGCHDFAGSTRRLAELWSDLQPSDIFRCDVLSQATNSLAWILDLSVGGMLGGGNAHSLLDASPLKGFLARHLDCEQIQANIEEGRLYALAISATNYNSGKSYLFIQGKDGHPMWNRSRRVTLSTRITVNHICASAAIPLVFRPVKLTLGGESAYFGDGCIRLQQPLSPIVRLGADKILAIGVRGDSPETARCVTHSKEPSLAEVVGVLLDVMFLDHLSTDIEHLDRLNRLFDSVPPAAARSNECEGMRPLYTCVITPSVHVSLIAEQHQKDMPYLIQYFVNSLGRDAASCADLMSYLLFSSGYTRALIDIGYKDASGRISEIEDFLYCSRR